MLKDEVRRGDWCECWTEDLTGEGPLILRASFDAYTAPQADSWAAVALRTISPARDAYRRRPVHFHCRSARSMAVSEAAGSVSPRVPRAQPGPLGVVGGCDACSQSRITVRSATAHRPSRRSKRSK